MLNILKTVRVTNFLQKTQNKEQFRQAFPAFTVPEIPRITEIQNFRNIEDNLGSD